MTHLARLLSLALLAAAPAAAFAEGYSGTLTGPNGGTSTFTGSCERGDAGVSCSRDSLLTGPKAATATRKLDRLVTRDSVTTRVTTTGANGRSVTTTRERKR